MQHVLVSYRWLRALERARVQAASHDAARRGSRPTRLGVATAFALAWLAPGVATAHIELSEPLARYEVQGETGIKGCPCGMATGGGNSNRTCKVDLDGSDPNRNAERAFTAQAGATVVLKFKETVGHAGKYRVAFDPEGADFNDFNDNVLTEVDDPQGSMGNVQNGNDWEIEVTLPETPCTNCTLQLIQVMEASTLGNSVDGTKLANMSTYYACIDLVLTGEQGSTAEPGSESVEVSTADVGSIGSTEASGASADASSSSNVPATDIPPATTPSVPPSVPSVAPTTAAPAPNPPPVAPITPAPAPSSSVNPTAAPTTAPPAASTTSTDAPGSSSGESGGCSVAASSALHTNATGATAIWALVGLALSLGLRRRRAS